VKRVAKSEKKAAAKADSGKAASNKSSGAEAPASKEKSGNTLFIIGAVAAAVLVGGLVYWQASSKGGTGNTGEKKDPDLAELMAPGPLPDMALGNADAPNIIVEYASMTCPHCAVFEKTTFPDLKSKYVETGKVRFIFREFPLDGLAARASMLARCAPPDRYFPMIDALFQTQENWAVQGKDGMDRLLQFARQAGFTKESFDKCMDDKELFNKIVESRTRAHETFGVDSTPSFFVNGKRLSGEHEVKDFDSILTGATPTPDGGATPMPEGGATLAPEGSGNKPEGPSGQ
jgi:protein-disulfide isomerase